MVIHLETIIKTILAIVGLITFGRAVYEYRQQRIDKRAQQFLSLRANLRENPAFQNILSHLYSDSDFSSVSDVDRIEFMGFYEDLAFLMNSCLLKKQVAFYMFGGDVTKAWLNDNFWSKERKDEKKWAFLKDFVDQMQEEEKSFRYDRKGLRL